MRSKKQAKKYLCKREEVTMNHKKTNYLVSILNIIAIVSIYVLYFSTNYLMTSIMSGETSGKSMYNSFIIDILVNNIQLIMALVNGGVGIFNIICAFQNKENKKLCFWQLVFGIHEIWSALAISVLLDNSNNMAWGNIIIAGIIPIILATKNLIFIPKNKPKIIQIISYVVVIIIAVLDILNILGAYWNIIAVIMQFVYIHGQEKQIEESSSRKIINIILYYVLQLLLVIGFFFMVISSLLITKVNEVKWENELSKLYNNIETLQGATTKDIYIPVEKNYKYGFINEKGEEKIQCEYDRVTYFNEIEINNNTYYIALAKKEDKFYILSKSSDYITISTDMEKYLQTMNEYIDNNVTKDMNENGDYRLGYLEYFGFFLHVSTKMELNWQTVEKSDMNQVDLSERNAKYYYDNRNYSMLIEPENTKYNVTITKNNGEIESSIVYLPGFDEEETMLSVFTNGYIEFEDGEHKRKGWYDDNGNKTTISNNYTIEDIKDGKAILRKDNVIKIIDMKGKTLLKTTALDIYDNIYLVKNKNNKMVLIDKDLKEISSEYDKIVTTRQIDISPEFSSYY